MELKGRRVWVSVLLAASFLVVADGVSRAKLLNNGYEGLVIGISGNIPEAQGAVLIPAIKELIKETSNDLFIATRQRAFFREVKIVVPISWTNTKIDQAAIEEKFQESDIRVGEKSSMYQYQPYTRQLGGCGDPGEYIYLTPEYLTDDAIADQYGRRGKTLVMSWAQYRWGVFEEVGFRGDKKYPMFYMKSASNRIDAGAKLKYAPNFCTNEPPEGNERSAFDQSKSCTFTDEGLPDVNCHFYPDSNQNANSSIMTASVITSEDIVEFCDDNTHEYDAKNKHNTMCKGRSVWSVMLDHEDFKNNANSEVAVNEEPVFKIVQEALANYVLVLDYSGSMSSHDRMMKLQKRAQEFLLYTVALESSVAVVRFDSSAQVLAPLTKISSDADRQTLANSIHINNDGGTSIGSGLKKAVEILNGKNNKNIVIITDGEENENPRISDVFDEVVNNNICVMTIAFGDNADQGLEELADATKCQAFTVHDKDITNAMHNAFEAATTRQPVPDIQKTNAKLFESNEIRTTSSYSEEFDVDFTIGKELTFRMKTDDPSHVITPPVLIRPDGTTVGNAKSSSSGEIWTIVVPMAEVGTWKWQVELSQDSSKYIQATISSLPRGPNIQPIITTVNFHAPTTGANSQTTKVKIIATVMQGKNPVIGAKVKAIVTPPDTSPPKEYDLFDNGKGADNLANDGTYSRFMTHFPAKGRYSIKAIVTGGDGTVINGGQSSPAVGRRRRSVDPTQGAPHRCCGSEVPVDPATAKETGKFTRVASGGSLKILNPPPTGDFLAPAQVSDLSVINLSQRDAGGYVLNLTWSATGDDLDEGTATKYIFRVSETRSDLNDDSFLEASEQTMLHYEMGDLEANNVLAAFQTPVSLNVTYNDDFLYGKEYFVGLVALDEANNRSPVSNLARIFLDQKLVLPPWASVLIQGLKKNIAEFAKERQLRNHRG